MKDARLYLGAWLALVMLAAGSLALSDVPLGPWSTFAAFAIAAVKAGLVVLFFMHVLRMRSAIRLAAAVAAVIFGLLVALSTADVLTRDPPPIFSPRTMSKARPVD